MSFGLESAAGAEAVRIGPDDTDGFVTSFDGGKDDIPVDRCGVSGFRDTPPDGMRRNPRVPTLPFAGVHLEHCVPRTLQDANLGSGSIPFEDGAAATSPSYRVGATLRHARRCFGFMALAASPLAAMDP